MTDRIRQLKDKIKLLKNKNAALREKLYAGSCASTYTDWKESATPTLVEYVESMAAAFCKFTDLNPNQCVLHTGVSEDNKKILYWFEEKTEDFRKDIKHEDVTEYINGD